MLEHLFGNTVIPLLEQVISFTEARHRALASNIANAATPGYRARDVAVEEFVQQLRRAAAQWRSRPEGGFHFTSTRHNRVDRKGNISFQIIPDPSAPPPGPDGNNVDLERQMVALIENTLRHNIALELLRKQFSQIQAAIRERM